MRVYVEIGSETLVLKLVEPRAALLLLASIAGGTLLTVFALEHIAGLHPCQMCIWQRWPFAIMMVLGVAGFVWQPRAAVFLMIPLMLVSAGLGGYHVGVEQGWIALPAGCMAGNGATSIEELKALLANAPPSCDQIDFTMLGLSLAGWNVVLSLILAGFSLLTVMRTQQVPADKPQPA